MEPLDQHRGEVDERRTTSRRRGQDRGRDPKELHARRQLLGARRTPVLGPLDHDLAGEDRPDRHASAALRLDHCRGERRERARAAQRRHRPVAPEARAVEDALSKAAKPAMERRKVERLELRRRLPEPFGRLEVPLRRGADDRNRVGLPRDEIGWQYSEPAPAGPAECERELDCWLAPASVLLAEEDRPPSDPAPREAQADRVAGRARREAHPVRHRAAALTKVGEELTMLERDNRRNGLGGRQAGRSRFVGGASNRPPSSSPMSTRHAALLLPLCVDESLSPCAF